MVSGTWLSHLRCDSCQRSWRKTEQAILWSCRRCDYDSCPACSSVPPLVVLPSPPGKLVTKVLDEACNNGLTLQTTYLEGWTALHYAALAGRSGVVKRLLEMRASPACVDANGWTPLHWAAFSGHDGVIEELLRARASTEATGANGEVPLALAPPEMVRHAFDLALETFERGLPALKICVTGSGDAEANGEYVRKGLTRNGRQTYIRDGQPLWAISWEADAWGIYKEKFHVDSLQYISKCTTPLCPMEGWEPVGAAAPEPTFTNGAPWRAGDALLQATPVKLRPNDLKVAAGKLPPPEVPKALSVFSQGGVSMPLPPGIEPHMLPMILEEMVRRGDLPEPPPECVQQ